MTIKPISEVIRQRVKQAGASCFANHNISEYIQEGEHALLKQEIEQKLESLFDSLVIDRKTDHNSIKSPHRIAKMYMDEFFSGRYYSSPDIAEFPNCKNLDELYVLGPISMRSTCAHHFVPIAGQVWVGILPNERIIGMSKFNRIVDWIMARPQIQEEASIMLADMLEEIVQPQGLAIVVKAQHFCVKQRGVKDDNTYMTTSVMRGLMRTDEGLRQEFLSLIKNN